MVDGPSPSQAAPVIARRRRYTPLRMAVFLAFLALVPGLLFALVFVKIQCYPGRVPISDDPARHGLRFETLHRKSPAGVDLVAWYIPPPGSPAAAIVIVHGQGGSRAEHLDQARFLHDAGYGTLLLDLRHHGESGSAPLTFGMEESREVQTFLDVLERRPEHAGQRLGLLGYSMGAATALRTGSLDPRVAAVVADSSFSSLVEQARHRISIVVPGPLVEYVFPFVMAAGVVVTGHRPSEWNIASWVDMLHPRPVFLIHGEADGNIPCEATRALVARVHHPVESWIVPGAGHIAARTVAPDEYARRVVAFFARSLPRPAPRRPD